LRCDGLLGSLMILRRPTPGNEGSLTKAQFTLRRWQRRTPTPLPSSADDDDDDARRRKNTMDAATRRGSISLMRGVHPYWMLLGTGTRNGSFPRRLFFTQTRRRYSDDNDHDDASNHHLLGSYTMSDHILLFFCCSICDFKSTEVVVVDVVSSLCKRSKQN
jgi:hypothetical protein